MVREILMKIYKWFNRLKDFFTDSSEPDENYVSSRPDDRAGSPIQTQVPVKAPLWRINELRNRSQGWNDNDLKEMVECIYFLNNQVVRLSNSLLAKRNLDGDVQKIRLFINRYEEILALLEKNREKGIDTFKVKLKQPYEHICSQIIDLDRSAASDSMEYQRLSDELRGELRKLPLTSLTKYLGSLVDDELLDKYGEAKAKYPGEPELIKRLENKIEKIADFVGLEVINPSIGEPYNEQLHEIIDQRKGDKPNTVYKVHRRGFQRKGTDSIEKAKITVEVS